jgi:hypothetical protein
MIDAGVTDRHVLLNAIMEIKNFKAKNPNADFQVVNDIRKKYLNNLPANSTEVLDIMGIEYEQTNIIITENIPAIGH